MKKTAIFIALSIVTLVSVSMLGECVYAANKLFRQC